MAGNGVDTMWFLPSALNVKVKKFNYARVNGGSNYNSLKLNCYLEREMWCSNTEQVKNLFFWQHNQIAGKSYIQSSTVL